MDRSQILEIRLNLFDFLCNQHTTNQKSGKVKQQKGWISAIDSYLTLGHKDLYKEIKAP